MTLEERVLILEKEMSNLNGKVTVIMTMNVAILLAVVFLGLKLV